MRSTRRFLPMGLVTILLIAILLSQIENRSIWTTIRNVDPAFLIIGFVLYVLIMVLRAIRLSVILDRKVPMRTLLTILFVHNFFNNLIPARLGELSHVYLLKERANLPVNYGISSLMIARVFDILGISFLFLVSFYMVEGLSPFVTFCLLLIGVLVAILFVILILLLFYEDRFLVILGKVAARTRLDRYGSVRYALGKGEETLQNFKIIRSGSVAFLSFFISVMIWMIAGMMTHMFLLNMDILLCYWTILIASGILVVTTVLPIHSFGGFGTLESIWTTTYVALGVSTQMAISSGFGIHIIQVVYFLILGGIGFLIMHFDKSPTHGPPGPCTNTGARPGDGADPVPPAV